MYGYVVRLSDVGTGIDVQVAYRLQGPVLSPQCLYLATRCRYILRSVEYNLHAAKCKVTGPHQSQAPIPSAHHVHRPTVHCLVWIIVVFP